MQHSASSEAHASNGHLLEAKHFTNSKQATPFTLPSVYVTWEGEGEEETKIVVVGLTTSEVARCW